MSFNMFHFIGREDECHRHEIQQCQCLVQVLQRVHVIFVIISATLHIGTKQRHPCFRRTGKVFRNEDWIEYQGMVTK